MCYYSLASFLDQLKRAKQFIQLNLEVTIIKSAFEKEIKRKKRFFKLDIDKTSTL